MASLNRGQTGDKNVDIIMPGAFGGREKQTIDNADIAPSTYATDWFRIYTLPARPSLVALDVSGGVLAGAWITAISILLSNLYAPFVGLLFALTIAFVIVMTSTWAYTDGSNWTKAGVIYRWATIVAGVALFVL